MTWLLNSDRISANYTNTPEPDIGDMMSYDEYYGWKKTEDKKLCRGVFIERTSEFMALIRLITPSERAFLNE